MISLLRVLADSSCTSDGFCTNLPQAGANSSNLQHAISITIGIIAAVAVLIIVISALQMVLAQSDPQKVARSRETIIYALVGLIISISAEVIVNFVLGG